MTKEEKKKSLKLALRVIGVIFLLVYPLSIVWPSGSVWHGGEGVYYFQMIVGIYAVPGVFLSVAAKGNHDVVSGQNLLLRHALAGLTYNPELTVFSRGS